MGKAISTYWQLTAEKNGEKITLTFINRDVMESALWALKAKGCKVTRKLEGAQIERSVADAVQTAMFWLRD